MRNLMNPRWLIVINTIPVLLLAATYFGAFQIIHTLLEPESIRLWAIFGGALFFLWINTLIYALLSIQKKQNIHALYGLISLIFHIPFLYIFAHYFDDIIPFSIPLWMLPDNMILYIGSFLMPTMAHALLTLVIGLTPPREGGYRSWKNFLLAFSIPLLWYFFMQVIFPLWRPFHSRISEHVVIIAVLASTTIFLLFLGRGFYVLAQKRGPVSKNFQLLWKIPVTLIFPILGLLLNNGYFDYWNIGFDGVFGDFNHPWFYAIAVLNGIILCLPRPEHAAQRLLLFATECMTFSYTIYFFFVFIPFLPFSVLAILGFGLGFLLLSPLALMVIHGIEIGRDFRFLKQFYSSKTLSVIFILGAAFIPLTLSWYYTQDRYALHDALSFVYQSDFDEVPPKKVNTTALQRVIATVRSHKDKRSSSEISIGQTPFLSPFYNWVVLDNLTLSENKIRRLEEIFLGKSEYHQWDTPTRMPDNDQVAISGIKTQANYDSQQQAWTTWVDLEITNYTGRQKEFFTSFELPEGAWISDYYLWIEREKVPGILAEKKSATWVYRQIVSRRRDPGILYYLRGNRVNFRVFPFAAQQTRKTGFEILHKEPLTFELGGQKVQLGDSISQGKMLTEAIYSPQKEVVYIPNALKEQLPEVERTRYFHFIVDCSVGKDSLRADYVRTLNQLAAQYPEAIKNAQISFTNTYTQQMAFGENWQQAIQEQDFSGGFYLERSIKSILVAQGLRPTPQVPQIMVLSNHIDQAILPYSFTDYILTPEVTHFQQINTDQMIKTFALSQDTGYSLGSALPPSPKVLAWPNAATPLAYLPASPGPAVVLLKPMEITAQNLPRTKNWADALEVAGRYQSYQRYPGQKDEEWLPMVKNSLASHLLTPVMSFISLENEAQRTALIKKQAQVLKGNQALDLDEEAHRMSEPGFFICLLIMILWGFWFRKKHPGFLRQGNCT